LIEGGDELLDKDELGVRPGSGVVERPQETDHCLRTHLAFCDGDDQSFWMRDCPLQRHRVSFLPRPWPRNVGIAASRFVGPWRRSSAGLIPSTQAGLTRTMLNGVSVARRMLLTPAPPTTTRASAKRNRDGIGGDPSPGIVARRAQRARKARTAM